MDRPESPCYEKFAVDPDLLGVPVGFVAPAIDQQAPWTGEGAGARQPIADDEPLVPVAHVRLVALATYHQVGWHHARPDTLLRHGTVARLAAVASDLPESFGLAVFDAWRPMALQVELYEAAYADKSLPEGFVAEPSSDPSTPPPHLTGGAVDLTLTWHGAPLRLGTDFDDFTPAAHPCAFEKTPGRVRSLRRLLVQVMGDAGFVQDDREWWHFEYGTRRWAAAHSTAPLYGPAAPSDRQVRVSVRGTVKAGRR